MTDTLVGVPLNPTDLRRAHRELLSAAMERVRAAFPSVRVRGYLHEDDRYRKCFAGDWYLTGDLARRDAEGWFWFVGRADDVIKASGHLIGPFEVENVLTDHPAVAEAAVIGKPDPTYGELVKAFVTLKSGHVGDDELRRELYLCGLLSQIDLILGEPLPAALQRLPLSGRVNQALLSQSGPYAPYLALATALESSDTPAIQALCEAHGLASGEVNRVLLRTLCTAPLHAARGLLLV